jgi:diketogulonate reductase-like aldo/keto reductase
MEVNPFHPQQDIVDYCNAGSIVVINNEPLCKCSRNNHPTLVELSASLGLSVEEVCVTIEFYNHPII